MLNDWLGQGVNIHPDASRNLNLLGNIEVKILAG
jgi:hypothetical protein